MVSHDTARSWRFPPRYAPTGDLLRCPSLHEALAHEAAKTLIALRDLIQRSRDM
jgi:hypothetical protein